LSVPGARHEPDASGIEPRSYTFGHSIQDVFVVLYYRFLVPESYLVTRSSRLRIVTNIEYFNISFPNPEIKFGYDYGRNK
jgi:hypothetical protein